MNKHLILATFSLLIGFIVSCKPYLKQTDIQPVDNMKTLEALWKEIDSLENIGLIQSALDKTETFITAAKKENKPDYTAAGILRKAGYLPTLKEGGDLELIGFLEAEAEASQAPLKPVLQSYLAQSYADYLRRNFWKFQERTDVGAPPSDDISTWTLRQFEDKIRSLYWASVADESLKQLPINEFKFLLADSSNIHLRPTLFDLLAFRALDHFSNDASWLTKPAYEFEVDHPLALAPVESFLQWKTDTKDTASHALQVIRLYQELLEFRLAQAEKYPDALLDADLKRLEYARHQAVFDEKDEVYLQTLQAWKTKLQGSPLLTLVMAKEAEWYSEKGNLYNALKDKFTEGEDQYKWHLKTAVGICDRAINSYPDTYGAKVCQAIRAQILLPSLNLQAEDYIVPGKPVLVRLSYKNLQNASLRVYRMNDNRLSRWQQIATEHDATKDRIDFLLQLPVVQTKHFELPDDGDHQNHAVEVGLDELQLGTYLLVLTDAPDLKEAHTISFTIVQATHLGLWQRNDLSGRPHFIVYHRQQGGAVSGVTAEFFYNRYDSRTRTSHPIKIGSTTSNEDGFFFFPSENEERSFSILLHLNDDTLRLNNSFYNYSYDYSESSIERSIVLLDRNIYRPGQTVYFKVFALKFDELRLPSVQAGKHLEVTLKDANYQKLTSLQLRTNEFGTAHGHFVLPSNGLTGIYYLESSFGENMVSFRVEDYKRPKFEVVLQKPTQAYRLGDSVQLTGLAKAYAGFHLDGAKVRWSVVREARYPWLPFWLRRWYPIVGESREIAHGETVTNANGEFELTFLAMPDKSTGTGLRPEFHFRIYADVTDLNGETQTAQSLVVVGEEAIRLDADVQEEIRPEQLVNVSLTTENLNGEPVTVEGTYQLDKLTSPQNFFVSRLWELPDRAVYDKKTFKSLFPHFAWELEDSPAHWSVERTLLSGKFNSALDKHISLNANGVDPGWYVLTLKANDPFGKEVLTKKYFMVWQEQSRQLPITQPIWAKVESGPHQPGQTARAYFRAPGQAQIYVELVRSSEVLQRKWIPFDQLHNWAYVVQEADRGNLQLFVNWAGHNRTSLEQHTLLVPWSNKDLQVSFESFRDKLLPGQQEEWRIRIRGAKGEVVAAEVLASMYDASLDAFVGNDWYWSIWPNRYSGLTFSNLANQISDGSYLLYWRSHTSYPETPQVPRLRSFSTGFYRTFREAVPEALAKNGFEEADMMANPAAPESEVNSYDSKTNTGTDTTRTLSEPVPQIRENLNETVFFQPELRTNAEGDVVIAFTMNEALTKWKFRLLAHTKQLEAALATKEVITQKDLMVLPNPPRFFREGDEIEYTAKVVNLTNRPLRGNAQLQLVNPLNSTPVYKWHDNPQFNANFSVPANGSVQLAWRFKVPDVAEVPIIENTVMAWAGDQSDGERNVTPVLSNRMLITETLPLSVRGNQQKNFLFDRLRNANSPTLSHHWLTLEFTSNPAWYAVQAMPYLMEYPYDCSEQIFSRVYANTLAASVVNSSPKIKAVFDRWRNEGASQMLSNLSKNPSLKTALLEETPWVLNAQDEATQKRNIALLFDLHQMAHETTAALQKLQEKQLPGGGWPWFAGERDNWYITQYIVEGFGRLRKLGANDFITDPQWAEMIRAAVIYCDERMIERYENLANAVAEGKAKWEDDHLDYMAAHYLYSRSFYTDASMSAGNINSPGSEDGLIPLEGKAALVFDYYLSQAEKYWLGKGYYTEGMLALALNRNGKSNIATTIARSLKERAIVNEELGMYWNYPEGWWWYQAPIETHALMIEVFSEVTNDQKSVDELRIWLLKNKQTNHWKTTKATANAVYALLMSGTNWLDGQPVKVKLGSDDFVNSQIANAQQSAESGSGYFTVRFDGNQIAPDMASVSVSNPNNVIAWGALYWQYFEDLNKITSFRETPLTINKKLWRVLHTDEGEKLEPLNPNNLRVGDKVVARIELKVDRDMEYVHMKDMRASAFEPENVLSTYKWQGGLGYYESTRDAATNFFFPWLPKGSYVFEYRMKVTNRGTFSNGITTVQCMYAPEYTSHSEGLMVEVK